MCEVEGCEAVASVRGKCRRHYNREYVQRRRKQLRDRWIASQGGRCVECGGTDDLEVDHVDPLAKSREISDIWTSSENVRLAELVKCQVLCHDCHLSKTQSEREAPHGRPGPYMNGCRCQACVEGMAAYKRERRHAGLKT
ncbi:5-methylcytosine-specific restriction endonuclease McrA [Microbacterium sp. SORGH_AS 505]|uniref:HNH endonuclease n=1 Tax=Microbacterium sp. SORGH_AS_0505 TaxID=3041770 RepID=UPI00277DE38F|nr:hypothetical protein [Microbacterium sp. SORGH_AS_0505]MDQ1127582.1 5-methylcytosine-specific restriction endonuclease McrA [Microbacterium sp. SORGH_AS_0505]